MPYLILVTILWAFSFSLIWQYLAGQVDSDLAVLVRVAIAAAVFHNVGSVVVVLSSASLALTKEPELSGEEA